MSWQTINNSTFSMTSLMNSPFVKTSKMTESLCKSLLNFQSSNQVKFRQDKMIKFLNCQQRLKLMFVDSTKGFQKGKRFQFHLFRRQEMQLRNCFVSRKTCKLSWQLITPSTKINAQSSIPRDCGWTYEISSTP